MNNPYIADRATVETWSEDGDLSAQQWLKDYPRATLFGVDDDEIQTWFSTPELADVWLADMARDSAERHST